jgi:hypothetical protein
MKVRVKAEIVLAMLFSAFHANHVSEERLRSVVREYLLDATKLLLAASADKVAQSHVGRKIAKRRWEIVLFRMQGLGAMAKAGRLRIDASVGFTRLGVHHCRSLSRHSGHENSL